MNTISSNVTTVGDAGVFDRLRNLFGSAVFLVVRRSPKLLEFYRNARSWAMFRVLLGIFGAALVVLPLSLWRGWITGVIGPILGLGMFVASILLPDPQVESETDRKANELGAATVVGGGEYQPGNAPAAHAQLFISPAHIWAMDKLFHPLVVIETPEISRILLDHFNDASVLRIHWAEHRAEFCYRGIFAERFARLAADAIHDVTPRLGQSSAKRRAASV